MVRTERGERTGRVQRQLGASEGNGSTETMTTELPCPRSSLTGVEVTALSGWSIATSAARRPRLEFCCQETRGGKWGEESCV